MADDQEPQDWYYTSDPRTIWAIPEEIRGEAVADIFRKVAKEYLAAVNRDDAKAAQEWAVSAIGVIGGLFPDQGDDAHHLIQGLIGANVAARSGSNDHILLRPGSRIAGTRGGYGPATLAGAAIAAVAVLTDHGMSKLAARKAVAEILSTNGLSLRRDEHGQPLPVTWSAIRRWEEEPEHYPLAAATASAFQATFEKDIAANGLHSTDEVLGLLREHAENAMPNILAY